MDNINNSNNNNVKLDDSTIYNKNLNLKNIPNSPNIIENENLFFKKPLSNYKEEKTPIKYLLKKISSTNLPFNIVYFIYF